MRNFGGLVMASFLLSCSPRDSHEGAPVSLTPDAVLRKSTASDEIAIYARGHTVALCNRGKSGWMIQSQREVSIHPVYGSEWRSLDVVFTKSGNGFAVFYGDGRKAWFIKTFMMESCSFVEGLLQDPSEGALEWLADQIEAHLQTYGPFLEVAEVVRKADADYPFARKYARQLAGAMLDRDDG